MMYDYNTITIFIAGFIAGGTMMWAVSHFTIMILKAQLKKMNDIFNKMSFFDK